MCPGPRSTTSPAPRASRRAPSRFAFNNRPGPRARDPGADPRHRPRARLDAQLARPGALGVPRARRRPGDGPAAGDAARGPVLPVVHRRRGERAVRARLRAAAPGGPRARGRAPELPPARRRGPRRRRLRHRPLRRRPPARAARRARAARGDRRAGPRRRPTGPRSASTTAPASPRPSSTSSASATPGSPTSPARPRWCTAARAARPGRPPCRRRPPRGAVRRDRLLRRGRSRRHPRAARPRRAADRDRLRQRPDGDRRARRSPPPAGSTYRASCRSPATRTPSSPRTSSRR